MNPASRRAGIPAGILLVAALTLSVGSTTPTTESSPPQDAFLKFAKLGPYHVFVSRQLPSPGYKAGEEYSEYEFASALLNKLHLENRTIVRVESLDILNLRDDRVLPHLMVVTRD